MKKSKNNLLASAIIVLLLLILMTSCGLLEMRDATGENDFTVSTDFPKLSQAERYNEVEKTEDVDTNPQDNGTVLEAETDAQARNVVVRLAAAGGIAIDSQITADAALRANGEKAYSFLTMYAGVYPLIHNADVALTTLEAPCADPEVYPVTDKNIVNMPVESLVALRDLGFDVMNTAGTNVNACGEDGILSTVTNVCEAKMLQIGAYRDAIDANDIRIYEKGDLKIAFVSVVEKAPESDMMIPDLTDLTTIQTSIAYADEISDIVVISVTWDKTDSGKRKELAESLAEFGSDIIIGCNGTSLGEVEWIHTSDGTKTLVAYSLGNFISTGINAESVLSGVLSMDINFKDGIVELENVKITPVVTHFTYENKYQVIDLQTYSNDMASLHSIKGITVELLEQIVADNVPAEFLSE